METFAHRHRGLGWLLLAAFVMLAAGIGLRDPWPADEPRFALLSRYVLDTGEWLVLRRGDELYSDKPPVFMWLQAGAIWLAGGSLRLGFLLPSLLAALGTLCLVYDLGRRLWTRRVGLLAGWALLLTVQFTFQGKRAQIDAVLLFLVTLANHGLLLSLLRGGGLSCALRGWAAAGLGTITKAVGVLSLALLPIAALARRAGWPGLAPMPPGALALGLGAFVLATLPWLGPLAWALAHDPALHDYARTLLFTQTVSRYADSWHHEEAWWYHLGVIATLWLPAALMLPWALPAWARRLRRRDPRYLLTLGWALFVLVFFSIPEGKRDVYILPALPMVCLALAPLLPGLLRRRGPRRLLLAASLALGTLLLGAGLALLLGEPGFERRLLAGRGYGPEDVQWIAAVLSGIGAAVLAAAAVFRQRRAAQGLALGLAVLWLGVSLLLYPVLDRHSSARPVMEEVARRIGPDGQLAAVAWREQVLLMADRPVRTFGFDPQGDAGRSWPAQWRDAAAWQAVDPPRRWILTQARAVPGCVQASRVITAGTITRRTWVLVPGDAVPADCRDGRGIARPAARHPGR